MAKEFGEVAPGAGEGVPRRRGRGFGRGTGHEEQTGDPSGHGHADEHDRRGDRVHPKRSGMLNAVATRHDRAICQPVATGHARERGGQRHHGKETVGLREPGGGNRLGNRADHARREERRLTTDHEHGRQQQPEASGQADERTARSHAPGHSRGRCRSNENLRELAPDDHRPLRIPVGKPAGKPRQQHERQHESGRSDREHEGHLAPGDRLLAEADRQPAEQVVVDDREHPEGQKGPKTASGRRGHRFQVSPQFMRRMAEFAGSLQMPG